MKPRRVIVDTPGAAGAYSQAEGARPCFSCEICGGPARPQSCHCSDECAEIDRIAMRRRQELRRRQRRAAAMAPPPDDLPHLAEQARRMRAATIEAAAAAETRSVYGRTVPEH